MPSWDELARDIREQEVRAKRRREEERLQREVALRKVAEVDQMVKGFIRAAGLVGSRGESVFARIGFFKWTFGGGTEVRRWPIYSEHEYAHYGRGFGVFSNGNWNYHDHPFEDPVKHNFGRNSNGLFCGIGPPDETLQEDLKRHLPRYMLDHDIALPKA
jgi:hypothetical protein